jgi:hypothetical protein
MDWTVDWNMNSILMLETLMEQPQLSDVVPERFTASV